jgi:hypothetical protein
MLDKEKIIKNTKKYFETAEPFITNELTEFLAQDFISAPASTNKDLHNAFEGGLIDHLLRTTKFAISINGILPEKLRATKEEIIKVCFLFQIGKAHMYKPCTSEWHIKNQGKMYDFRDDNPAVKIGELSAYYALLHGVKLTTKEYEAIINSDKDDSDKQAKYFSSILSVILKQANELAIIEEKALYNDYTNLNK